MITRRRKDILVRFTVPLPRRFWLPHASLGRKHTEEARANMRAGQRERRAEDARERADHEALKEAELFAQEEVSHQ